MSFLSNVWWDAKNGFPETRKVFSKISDRLRRGYPLIAALILTTKELGDEVDTGIEELEALIAKMKDDLDHDRPSNEHIRKMCEIELAAAEETVQRLREERR